MNSIYKHSIKGLLLMAVALQLMSYATAQEQKTPSSPPLSIELRKARATWFESNNGAGIGLDSLRSYGSLEAGYQMTDGEFKRVQQGEKERQLSVETEGGQQLGNAYAWGVAFPTTMKQSAMRDSTRRCLIYRGGTLLSGRSQPE